MGNRANHGFSPFHSCYWLDRGYILGIALLVLAVIEVVKIFSDEKGQRIGDQMAKTMVIEKK